MNEAKRRPPGGSGRRSDSGDLAPPDAERTHIASPEIAHDSVGEPAVSGRAATAQNGSRPRRIPAWVRSVRFRLTVFYSLMMFGLASIVVGGIYWSVSRNLDKQIALQMSEQAQPSDDNQAQYEVRREIELLVNQQTLANLSRYSRVGLVALFFTSLGVGWYTAGRVLAPIGHITRVAQDIQATDLSRRIGLGGPSDELKELSDTFDAMLDRLQRAFDDQQRLIQDTSHELRNPLAVLRTNLDVTLSDPTADLEQYRHTAELVQRSSVRMSKLVDDLLAYARHEAAKRVESVIDLTALVTAVVAEFRPTASGFGLELSLVIEDGLLLQGHERSIEQSLSNLLVNAMRFAPESSTIEVRAFSQKSRVWVTVGDEGPGIAPADRERVFERFVRLSDGESARPLMDREQGSGLGLAIVREIARTHGGDVRVGNSDRGAKLEIWFPAHHRASRGGEFRILGPIRRIGTG